jgi:septation ring formation regulator EzrA
MAGYGYRGRYGSGGYDEEERRGIAKVLFSRSWFLIIPLIGLVYANARQVTPQVKELKQLTTAEEKAIQLERTQTLSSANRIRTHISALAALGDTFEVRFARIDSLMENITTFLEADRKASAKLLAEMDSLRQVYSLAAGKAAAYSESLQVLAPVIDSLRAVIADRNAQAKQLWSDTADNVDQADRILYPEKYRKKNALVTGEGDFPSRDELPKR